jgi:(4-O-methyl)-D-glucuronate---lignin esterase
MGGDELMTGFVTPPGTARPRAWWHWMNGNITQDGIRKDMEWMQRVGIGGLQNFDANLFTPQIVDKRLVYMTPEWKDAFRYAAGLAQSLGLELAIASSPGWSETGGPWVQPKDGLKKLVWSETVIPGGRHFNGKLVSPPAVTGPFQSMPLKDPMAAFSGGVPAQPPTYYADAIVLAYPVANAGELPLAQVTASTGEQVDAAKLSDGDLQSTIEVRRGTPEQPSALVLTYPTPQTIRSAALYIAGKTAFTDVGVLPRLEASMDGNSWRKIADIPLGTVTTTVSFAPVTARQFRLVLEPTAVVGLARDTAPGVAGGEMFSALTATPKSIKIGELRLSPEAKVDRFEAKAGFTIEPDYFALSTGTGVDLQGVDPSRVLDITGHMKADGTLDWIVPKGKWRVLRLGYSLLGTTNHPASREATGLEVDKFDGSAVRNYLETYLGMYRDAAGPDLIGEHGVRALLTDSIEVGAANWTPRIVEQFKRLRGYDPTPWLPALTGDIIGSRGASDAFLYDFRRTLADLMASEHYGTVATVAHEHALKVYGEALEDGRPSLGDDMAMRSHTDIPMSAMWTYGSRGPKPTYLADIKGAASVAHIYGQNLVAAESMTSMLMPWAHAPADLRRVIDLEFLTGVNRPVIHTSVHQPVDDKVPGLALFVFGQYFNRHETWAEMARPWIDYLARSSYLLQQGRYFADVAYFYGEEAPLTGLYGEKPVTDAPVRYGYDFVNADALLNQLSVQSGDLVAKSGARYKLLYLGGSSEHMTLPVLRQLASLVDAGATIVGQAPESSPSLNDDKAAFDTLVRRLWSGQPVTTVGQGRVLASRDVEGALASLGVGPDFSYTKPDPDTQILFLHRRVADGDLYFIGNRKNRPERVEARFRVTGKAPQIWRADSGTSEPVSYRIEQDETVVPLDLDAEEAFFVVFRTPTTVTSATIDKPALSPVATLDGSWSVVLQPKRGDAITVTMASLGSLSEQADPAVKYFSGVAAYTKQFQLPRGAKPGAPLLLDLGKVGDLAEVYVNNERVGSVWHAPYRLDIGRAVKRGRNQLEIRVADLWVNRLIGDAQPGAKKTTYTAMPAYRADAPLRPSGLMGPVQLIESLASGVRRLPAG